MWTSESRPHRRCISALAAAALLFAACSTQVARDLEASQADKAVRLLLDQGIHAERSEIPSEQGSASYSVHVPQADALRATTALLRAGIISRERPLQTDSSSTVGGSLMPTRSEVRVRHALTVSRKLESSLEELGGVARARVHVAIDPRNGLMLSDEDATREPRASVLLTQRTTTSRSAQKTDLSDAQIKRLVAGAVTDLAPENVVVVRTDDSAPAYAPETLARVGPFSVKKTQATLLTTLLSGLLVLLAVQASLLFLLLRKKQRVATTSG